MWTCTFLFGYPLLVVRILTIKTWTPTTLTVTALPVALFAALFIGARNQRAQTPSSSSQAATVDTRAFSQFFSHVTRWLRWLVIPYLILIELGGFVSLMATSGNSVNLNESWLNYLLLAVLLAGIPVLALLSDSKNKWVTVLQFVGVLLLLLTLMGVITGLDFWMYPQHMQATIPVISNAIERIGGQFLQYVR